MSFQLILRPLTMLLFFSAVFATTTLYGQFEISWHTIDGGGGHSVGGAFELSGTIGQVDAGAMTAGNYELNGGFWAGAQKSILLGDVNLDGVVNLLDVDPFVAVLSDGIFQAEADCDENGVVNLLDVDPFILILSGG